MATSLGRSFGRRQAGNTHDHIDTILDIRSSLKSHETMSDP